MFSGVQDACSGLHRRSRGAPGVSTPSYCDMPQRVSAWTRHTQCLEIRSCSVPETCPSLSCQKALRRTCAAEEHFAGAKRVSRTYCRALCQLPRRLRQRPTRDQVLPEALSWLSSHRGARPRLVLMVPLMAQWCAADGQAAEQRVVEGVRMCLMPIYVDGGKCLMSLQGGAVVVREI